MKFCLIIGLALSLVALEIRSQPLPVTSSIASVAGKPTAIVLSWEAIPGKQYNVLTTSTLGPAAWQALNVLPIYATNRLVSFAQQIAQTVGFYRVVKLDSDPPEIWRLAPASNATAVGLQSRLEASLRDETAIDPSSIALTVGSNSPVTLADKRLVFADGVLTYTPGSDEFLGSSGQVVTNRLIVADTLGHGATNEWAFQLDCQPVKEVPGPAPGTAMTKSYVQMVGRMAYLWGWPLVNFANRMAGASKVSAPSVVGGVPVGYGRLAMLTGYMSPQERAIECPNQDVVYGVGFFSLDKEPVILQIPDFGDRFWVYALYDARTDEFSQIGKAFGTKPGFYLLVAPDWKGNPPPGIAAVVRASTTVALGVPRIFLDDTDEDRANILPLISQVNFYPLSEFDGTMKLKDWAELPHYPPTQVPGRAENQQVNPETFFDELPALMKKIPPMAGEEALYKWISSVLEAAVNDPAIKQTLQETASAAESEMITPVLMPWRYNGRPAGNGWNSPVNNAAWGTDYLNRAATARSNMFDNKPDETKYIYTDNDNQGKPLNGQNLYAVTFAKDQVPPVRGFWSLTLYDGYHFFHPNDLKRYSLGTKNKTLIYNPDGSLTIYAGASSPGVGKESNWLPAPKELFSLYIRAYWPDQAILDGTWTPPTIEKLR